MKVKFGVILVLFSLVSLSFQCTCTREAPEPPKELKERENFQQEKEIINGVDYGFQVAIGDFIFLQKSVKVSRGTRSLPYSCPDGYRLPEDSEIKSILNSAEKEKFVKLFLDKDYGLGLVEGRHYMTTTKTYPEKTDGQDPDSWAFRSYIVKKNDVQSSSVGTFFAEGQIEGKCMKSNANGFSIVVPEKETVINRKITISLSSNNFKAILWRNGRYYSTKDKFERKFEEYGCQKIEVWAKNIADKLTYSCATFYIVNPFYSTKSSTFDPSKVTNVVFDDIRIAQVQAFHFFGSTAPISPKLDGGFYMVYLSTGSDKNMHVINFDKDKNVIENKDLGFSATPFDIAASDWGFGVLFSMDGTTLKFNGYYEDFTLRFSTIIFQNDRRAFKLKDQFQLYLESGFYYGTACMYSPGSGKVLFTKGVFVIAQASYNSFDAGSDKDSPNGHTGDQIFIVDENGENNKIALCWSSSHTNTQTLTFDGEYVAYATLGDAYPKNLKATIFNPTQKTSGTFDNYNKRYVSVGSDSKVLLDPEIPADMAGKSCGRMGGIHYNGKKYALVYSIRPCTSGGKTTTLNEVGLITFKNENGKITNVEKKILKGVPGKNVLQLRSGKYGRNILIIYIEADCGSGPCGYQGVPVNQKMSYVFTDFDGNVISGPFQSEKYLMNFNDDLRELRDGTLIWSYLDSSSKLKYAYVSPP